MDAIGQAINRRDDDAMRHLVCAGAWNENLSFQETRAELIEADSQLSSMRYLAQDWHVISKTGTTAVATMRITVDGVPGDLSEQGQQALSSGSAPIPLNMFGIDHQLNLVKQGPAWLACGPLGVRPR